MPLDLSLLLLVIFLPSTLVIYLCSLTKKATNFREHTLGHRQFSTATIVATIVACYCPAGLLSQGITHAYKGISYIVYRMTIGLFPLLLLSWLAGRMQKFVSHLSMAESMASVYGPYARFITALFELWSAVIIVSLQIRIICDTVGLLIPSANSLMITILITVFMVVYAMFGGARAIAFTDVWQCIVFSTLILVLAWCVFKNSGKTMVEIIDFVKAQKQFELSNLIPSDRKVRSILDYLANSVAPIGPYLVQHIYMGKSPAQARKACLYAGIFSTVVITSTTVVGLLVFVCFPYIPSTVIWDDFLANASSSLKGIVCMIILSFGMSTVDSRLHVASTMLAYDIPKSIGCFRKFIYLHQLKVARVALLAVALLTMVLAFNFPISTLRRILMWYLRFYVPVIMAPFILAVLGLRTSSFTGLVGIVTGLLAMLAWQKWMVSIVGTSTGHVPCMLMNGLAMAIAHYVTTQHKTNK
ncbi:Sodium:solute symporter family protein [Cardinium endosymbiont cBtQ1 of Bemisia tabaci]|nr:Sodium:solute symporter family protein [Cardinium endosymbiont cBtQ1 of Bemisia tabaci]